MTSPLGRGIEFAGPNVGAASPPEPCGDDGHNVGACPRVADEPLACHAAFAAGTSGYGGGETYIGLLRLMDDHAVRAAALLALIDHGPARPPRDHVAGPDGKPGHANQRLSPAE